MVLNKHSKEKEISLHDVTTYEEQVANIKQGFFSIFNAHLQQNTDTSPYPFYLFLLIEHLALLWYLVQPGLNIYQGAYLSTQINSFLKVLNPHEYMKDDPSTYRTLILAVGIYLLLQILLGGISVYAVLREKKGEFFKYLRKVVNYQFLLTAKALSGPILGLVVNLVYCDPGSPYHLGQSCYSASQIIVVAGGAAIGLVILLQILLLALIYYIRNPLSPSYMAVQNRYYVLSKTILKVFMPLYFAVDPNLTLAIVYMFVVTGLWGAYIFWHRLFSIHSYNQVHFYVEYFMEAALFWVSASNLIYHYASNGPVQEELGFIYTLLSAVMVSGLLLSIEAYVEDLFLKECLSGKIKKQNMQKITFVFIHRLLNCPAVDSKLRLRAYSKLLTRNGALKDQLFGKEGEREERMEVYRFLLKLLQGFLEENNSTMLKAVRCHLTCHLGLRSYGIHQSLELEEQRLSLVEEFMLFQFREGVNLFQNEVNDKQNREFFKFYRFHEEFGKLEGYIEACGRNNADYWEEICEADPSLAKLRNLSTLYTLYEARITQQYQKICELVPQSLHAATLYLSFLGATGADVKGVFAMKEKLLSICEARSKSAKLSNEELREDQEMSIITLDTIGNNLGVVLNSNSHVKELLGFEKASLMGKNITKLMPKIYTQLHNSFMLNFIRSEHANETSVKRVTALNKNSLLVDINLSVRILSSSQSDLAIVGFMKKLSMEKCVGLVMYSVTNGDVLGIDENFVQLMNKRLSGKQVAQEEVRLNVLLPELKMQDLERQKEQQTFLEVGSSLEDEEAHEVQKKVLVRLKSIKVYEGVKLGFLDIVDIIRYQSMSSKPMSSFNSRIVTFPTKEIGGVAPTRRRKSKTQDLSIHFDDSQGLLDEAGEKRGKELAMVRLVEDFMKERQGSGVEWMLKILYCICVLGCMGTALYTYTSHADYLKEKNQFYISMNQTIAMANYFGQITTYMDKIWNIQAYNYYCTTCTTQFSKLQSHLTNLKITSSDLTKAFTNYKYPLQYNENNYYNFSYLEGINGTMQTVIRSSTYTETISNLIAAANFFSFKYPPFPSFYVTLQLDASFVHNNGELLMPTIAISAMNKFYSFFIKSLDDELYRTAVLKYLMMVVIFVCFTVILVLAHKLDKVNLDVVQIYSSLYLVNVNEVLTKANRFLTQRGLKAYTKPRTSVKIPTLVKEGENPAPSASQSPLRPPEAQSVIISPPQQPSVSNVELLTTEQPLVNQTHTNQERFMTFEDQHAQVEAEAAANEEATLKAKKPEEPTLKIEEERSNKRIILIMSIFLFIFAIVTTLSYMNVSSDSNSLKDYVYRLKVTGEIKKNINYINYYSFRICSVYNDDRTKSMLINEINTFFKLTQAGYAYLGDPKPVLKDTYSLVQTIQQYLTQPNVTSQQIASANYTSLESGLQTAIHGINRLDTNTFYPEFVDEINSTNQNELIFTILLIAFMCLAVVAMHTLHMGPIRIQSKHSLNMLKILPASLMQRSPKALKLIASV